MDVTVNTAWTNAPSGSDDIRDGDNAIRSGRAAFKERLLPEHYMDSGTQARHGEHVEGSAKFWWGGTTPTTRPGGTTLDSVDAGRAFIDTSANSTYYNILKVYDGTTFTSIGLDTGAQTIGGQKTFTAGLLISSYATLSGALLVGTTITGQGALSITSGATFSGALVGGSTVNFAGAATLQSSLNVAGNLTAAGILTLQSDLNLTGNIAVSGSLVGGSTANFAGVTTLQSALNVAGTLAVSGASTLGGQLSVASAVALSSSLDVAGGAGFSGAVLVGTTLGATGAISGSSTLTISGVLLTGSTSTLGGNTTISGNINAGTNELTIGSINRASGSLTLETGGTTAITIDSSRKTTLAGTFLLAAGAQNYLFGNRQDALTLQGQTPGTDTTFEMYTQEGDGTDIIGIDLWGVGVPNDIINRERLLMRWNTSVYAIYTEADGTGTLRPLVLYTEGNANQLYLATGGTVGIGTASVTAGYLMEVAGAVKIQGALSIGNTIVRGVSNEALSIFGGAQTGANIELYGGSHATQANNAFYDADVQEFRSQNAGTIYATLNSTGLTLGGDLLVDGGDIGVTGDTDLIQLASGALTINGNVTASAGDFSGTLEVAGLTTLSGSLLVDGGDIGITGDTDLLQLAANNFKVNGAAIFNEAGADVDFRVEGNTDANLLFVNAGDDAVCIGTDTFDTGSVLSIDGGVTIKETGSAALLTIYGNSDGDSGIIVQDSNAPLGWKLGIDLAGIGDGKFCLRSLDQSTSILVANSAANRITVNGELRINGPAPTDSLIFGSSSSLRTSDSDIHIVNWASSETQDDVFEKFDTILSTMRAASQSCGVLGTYGGRSFVRLGSNGAGDGYYYIRYYSEDILAPTSATVANNNAAAMGYAGVALVVV